MASRSGKFSWKRLITNMEPNFARDNPTDVNVTNTQADNLFRYQLTRSSPRYLDEMSFFVGGLVDQKAISQKTYNSLVNHQLIAPVPPSSASAVSDDVTVPTVYTGHITKAFANQFYFLSVHAQRKLVGLMFYWEEECTRWRLLVEEEQEIRRAIERDGNNEDLRVALAAIEMKRKMIPSKRAEATMNVTSGVGHALPKYE